MGAPDATTTLLVGDPQLDGQTPLGQQVLDAAVQSGLDEPEPLADFLVDLLDAEDLLSKTPWHFSRGETQIGAILVTFARPFDRAVLVDPTAGLDRRKALALVDFVVDLSADHEVHVYSDDVAWPERGSPSRSPCAFDGAHPHLEGLFMRATPPPWVGNARGQ